MNDTFSETKLNQRYDRNIKELKEFKKIFFNQIKVKDYIDIRVKKDIWKIGKIINLNKNSAEILLEGYSKEYIEVV